MIIIEHVRGFPWMRVRRYSCTLDQLIAYECRPIVAIELARDRSARSAKGWATRKAKERRGW